MALVTWGTAGDYATMPLALAYLVGLGTLAEDYEVRQISDVAVTATADYVYIFSTIKLNGNTLTLTNPGDYTYTVGTLNGAGGDIWRFYSGEAQYDGPVIWDGLNVVLKSHGHLFDYKNRVTLIIKNCRVKTENTSGSSQILWQDNDITSSAMYVRVYNCEFVDEYTVNSVCGRSNGNDGVGEKEIENCLFTNFSGFGSTGIYNTFTNCFFDMVTVTKNQNTLVTCATSSTTTSDIFAPLKSLVVADIFEKYLVADYADADYFQPKDETVLTTEETYPPTTTGHTLFYDGTEITEDNAVIGYKFLAAAEGGGGERTNLTSNLFGRFLWP